MRPNQDALLCAAHAGAQPPATDVLLRALLAERAAAAARPPWAAPVRLAPLHPRPVTGRRPARVDARRLARRAAPTAAALLLAGGLVAASVGTPPARAAYTPPATVASLAYASPAAAPATRVLALGGGALAGVAVAPAADAALLSRLLAAPTAVDEAVLAELLEAPVAAAPAAPAAVSFGTVATLPAAAFVYEASAVALPAVTLEQQRAALPPPAPPPPPPGQEAQPPAPAGYVQPPGYQDGVPFGGQPGAVPGSRPAQPARPARPAQPATPATYTVREGDTLASIALRFYGNARYAATIWEFNVRVIGANPNLIFAGQRLTLPAIAGTRPVTPAPLPARGPIARRANYTIQPRDFLRWMAQRAYGNEMAWREIYDANRRVLGPNPDLIYPNVTVYIP
jgi:nucleoid-associated protein YgaU